MAEEEVDQSTELLDQMDMAMELFKDSSRQLRKAGTSDPQGLEEFNRLLDQIDMSITAFKESVSSLRLSTSEDKWPQDADFARFQAGESMRRRHAARKSAGGEYQEFINRSFGVDNNRLNVT